MTKDFSIQKILLILLRHIKLIVLITVVATLLAYIYTTFYITPIYSASAIIQVSNYDYSQQATQDTTAGQEKRVWVSDLTSSATLADYCTVLFLNSPVMSDILDGCGLNITSENQTNFLRVTVSSSDPNKAAEVANAVTDEAPKLFLAYYRAGSIDTLRPATAPTEPSSPNVRTNVMLGFLGGLIFSVLLSLFLDIIDTTIKPDDDLFKIYGVPVFAEIVDFEREEK